MPGGLVLCNSTLHYSITFCSLLEAASDVVSGEFVTQSVFDNDVIFGYTGLHCSRDIESKVVQIAV